MLKGNTFYLVLITLIAATGGFLFGFDMAVISGALTFVQDQFNLTAVQEGWFVSSALIGCIIGVSASGEFSDRLGRRSAMKTAAFLFFLSAVGTAAAPSFEWLISARLLGGVGVGIASNVVPLYISEIAPPHIRGRLVTFYQLAITVGILFAYISNAVVLNLTETAGSYNMWAFLEFIFVDEVWRGMFGIETVPALLFLGGIFMIPESPRWLYNQSREDEGKSVLERIMGREKAQQSEKEIHQTLQEKDGSYRELLKPGLRKALIIGILLPVFSQFSGINAIIYYGPRILNEAGMEVNNALISQILLGFANMIFTFIAVWKVDSLGRRPLYLFGTAGATISLLLTGYFFYIGATGSVLLLISVIAFLACFAFSIGPLKFVIASEIFPNRIRGRALALSIMAMWISDTIVGQLTPMLLSAGGASTTFWFFAVFCVIAFWFIYKMVPETKGKSLEEIQKMWQ
ncbi:MAG: sugar porter family MFS transporter [Balneolaceae bacterium]|nr:sugar porter family MFS transporter [Balneolaceae bacterium]MDR9407332.1 sugar porter family MFS transporter [Balneolaceae bacterium]